MRNNPEDAKNASVVIFFMVAFIISVISLVFLLLIPADQKNVFLWGYSLNRLLLAGLISIASLSFLILTLISQNFISAKKIFNLFLISPCTSVIAILALLFSSAIAIITIPGVMEFNPAYADRIRPIVVWAFLLCTEVLLFKYLFAPQSLHTLLDHLNETFNKLGRFLTKKIFYIAQVFQNPLLNIILLLIVAAPVLLQNAIRYQFPVGVSGLYALMAESVLENHFQYPFDIPFYGPGGIPFAYPPLSFYIMAFFTGPLRISPIEYMRFAAPLFSLLALIPAYLLAKRITASGIIASIATLLIASYARIYLIHGQAAGLTRTLAFFFALSGLFFYYKAILMITWRDTILAGFFFGLAALTHPTYAEFFAVGAVAITFGIFTKPTQGIMIITKARQAIIVLFIGAIVASPWWLTVTHRHGSHLFSYASLSHDTLAFLSIFSNPPYILTILEDFFYKVNKSLVIAGPATLGFFYLLAMKKWLVPAWFILYIFFFGGHDFLVIPITAIMAATMLHDISQLVHKPANSNKVHPLGACLFTMVFIILSYYNGYKAISRYQPDLSIETFHVAEWFQNNTFADETFLRLSDSGEEPEWYPYLLRRSPVIASWGSEWTGDYKRQYRAVNQITQCSIDQSLTCIEETLTDMNVQPDYLIIDSGKEQMEQALQNSAKWIMVYQNTRYEIWALEDNLITSYVLPSYRT